MNLAAIPASNARPPYHRRLQLLVEWQPWWPTFLGNIADLFRRQPAYQALSAPGEFWPDVFVRRPLPWINLAESSALHVVGAFLLLIFPAIWHSRYPVQTEDPFQHTTITYHAVSEYLPELKSAPAPRPQKQWAKPDPAFAKQEIRSVPFNPDNTTQTIINPPHPNLLRREAQLPNLMVNTANPAPPVAALTPKLTLPPDLALKPVAPAPQVRTDARIALPDLQPTVAQPAPEVRTSTAAKLPEIDIAPAQPAPETHAEVRSIDLPVAAPALPVPAVSGIASRPLPGPTGEIAHAVAPAPETSTAGSAAVPAGQLVALSLTPAPPSAEIKVPDASRHGVFEASPAGRERASGTPDFSRSTGTNTTGSGNSNAPNSGVTISAPPPNTTPAAVAGPISPAKPVADLKSLMAKASVPDIPRQSTAPAQEPQIEDKVFGARRSYSMRLNMANLTSAAGSWIIRFAELNQSSAGELVTPEATVKVDPAYPAELIEQHVEGIVVLHAIIRANGTVGEVSVMHGFNDRLDENAKVALGQWHFRPALKNGTPVDLEAVVQIPFKLRKRQF